jgi:nitrogen fixation NifU-like protein
MKTELRELYQDLILDHGRKPRNFRTIPDAGSHAEGFNPLCGDQCTVYADIANDTVTDIAFQGKGCAISQASASLMTQFVKGKARPEIQHYFEVFQKMVKDQASDAEIEELGKIAALAGVKEFPSRVKCATLPWHTLIAALTHTADKVTTE